MKKLTTALVVLFGLALAACQTDDAGVNIKDLVAAVPGGGGQPVRLETRFIEHTFPSGQTADVIDITWKDPRTNRVMSNESYAFNGESLGRVGFKAVAGSIIPAAVTGGAVYFGDKAISPAQINASGGSSLAVARAAASSQSIVRVNGPLKITP